VIAAAVLYVPANVMPSWTRGPSSTDAKTYHHDVFLVLLHPDAGPIALLVFIARIVVPC